MDCFGTYTSHMPKAVITFVFKVLLGTCSIFAFSCFLVSRFRVFAFACFCEDFHDVCTPFTCHVQLTFPICNLPFRILSDFTCLAQVLRKKVCPLALHLEHSCVELLFGSAEGPNNFCFNKRSHVSRSFLNQESGQLPVSRPGTMHSAGLNPTDSEVRGGSFWSTPAGGGSEVLPRSGVQGVSLVSWVKLSYWRWKQSEFCSTCATNMKIFDFSSQFFLGVCGVWKTKYPRVIELPMGDAHVSMSTPTAFCFMCSIRTHGVGKAQFSCFHVILSFRWGPNRSTWMISPGTEGSCG